MMSMRAIGSVLVVVLASGCGPRLKRAGDAPPAAAAAAPDVPVANMTVHYEDAKLDAAHKYTSSGQFTVGGLFYKDGEPIDTVVKVSIVDNAGQRSRAYDIDLAALGGAAAKVEMWDDGFLTVVVPSGDAPKLGFETSNTNIKAAALEQPGQQPSTCYFGKQILDGQLRFALCELQTETPRIAFVDAVAEPAAPVAAPAEGEPAPATKEDTKTN